MTELATARAAGTRRRLGWTLVALATVAGAAIVFWPTALLFICIAVALSLIGIGTGDATWNDGEEMLLPFAIIGVAISMLPVVAMVWWPLRRWALVSRPTPAAWIIAAVPVLLILLVSFTEYFVG